MKNVTQSLFAGLLFFFSISTALASIDHIEIAPEEKAVGGGCGASFVANSIGTCPIVSFFSTSVTSGEPIYEWDWDFGDGTTSYFESPEHMYTANGTYLVCLTINTGGGCSDTYCDTINISCIAPPSCSSFFQYTLGLCPEVLFFDGSTSSPGSVVSWQWDFGDGSTSNSQNPSHTYTANGLYLTCLTISTTDGCTDTYCDTINVSCIAPPSCNADFQYTLGACPTVSHFDASTASPGSVASWSWDFGDGTTSNSQNPSHTYGANGSYVTCLTITTTDSCSSTHCDTVVVSCITPPGCDAFFQYTSANCPSISFFDASTSSPGSVINWFWDFGDGSTSSMQNPSHTYSANGTYLTCLTVFTSDSCTSTYCDTINISCITPVTCDANFQYTLGLCPTIGFFDASTSSPGSVASWSWSFGDGSTSNSQNPSHTYGANGSYVTCLTITTTDSCTSTHCDTVVVSCIAPPGCDAFFQYTSANCPSISFFDASTSSPGSVINWFWDFGDGSTSSMQNPSHTYSANGTYLTCLTVFTSDSCTSTYCDTVVVPCIAPPSCDNPTTFSSTVLQPTKAIMSWNSVPNAVQYKLKLRPSGTSSWTYITLTDTFKLKNGLLPGTNYEWKVKTICSSNSPSNYGPFQYFTTPIACLNPDTFSTSGVLANQATFNWNAVAGAVQYRVKYRVSGTGSWSYYFTATNSFTATGLNQATAYEWKVKTICASGSPTGYGPFQYFTTAVGCHNPTGMAVSSIHETGATMSWNAVSGAVQYKVKLRPTGTSAWTYITLTDTFKVKNGLLPSTPYEWKVKTICSSGSPVSYGPLHYFTTLADPCPNPSTYSADSITETAALLSWNVVPNATSYKLKTRPVGASGWFTTTVWAPDNFKFKTGLLAGTDYEWKVRTSCSSGSPSSYGPVQTFSTVTPPATEMANRLAVKDQGFILSYYPNPTNGELTIDLGGVFDIVSVAIRDLTGKMVFQKTYSEFNIESILLPGNPGIYTVQVQTQNAITEHFKVVKTE